MLYPSSMLGPEIIVRSLTGQRIPDQFGNEWQYHPQSDRHSKLACWAILFDLLRECSLLRRHVADGKVGFGINHTMVDFTSGRDKDLDLVVSIPREEDASVLPTVSFAQLAVQYGVDLSLEEWRDLADLPPLWRRPVGDVLMALEAKACMTAHQRAGPRLYDELTSAWQCINGSAQQAIAVGFGMVNAAPEFISPKNNKFSLKAQPPLVNREKQPSAALGAQKRIRTVRVRGLTTERGYDALGITTIEARNDGSQVTLAPVPPALASSDPLHYERMILRVAGIYDGRFQSR